MVSKLVINFFLKQRQRRRLQRQWWQVSAIQQLCHF